MRSGSGRGDGGGSVAKAEVAKTVAAIRGAHGNCGVSRDAEEVWNIARLIRVVLNRWLVLLGLNQMAVIACETMIGVCQPALLVLVPLLRLVISAWLSASG